MYFLVVWVVSSHTSPLLMMAFPEHLGASDSLELPHKSCDLIVFTVFLSRELMNWQRVPGEIDTA